MAESRLRAERSTDRVFEIDLLRFVAAVAVVFFHWSFRGAAADDRSTFSYPPLWPASQYGYLGVELFFMISGFVILMTASSGSLKRFVASRVARLYPAFWACCTITVVVVWLWGQPAAAVTLGQYLVNLTMLSDFVHVPSVDGAYWSLFVEIRFYAWVALLLAMGLLPRLELLLWLWRSPARSASWGASRCIRG
jgi:peptidoglycan/LPS O-acetylase OafA/YrhL